jgi:hypothetical protein
MECAGAAFTAPTLLGKSLKNRTSLTDEKAFWTRRTAKSKAQA